MYDLRRDIFAHVQKMPLAFYDRNPIGRLMTRVTSDVNALNELFSQGVMTLAGDVFLLVAIGIMMIYEDVRLASLVLITAVLPGRWGTGCPGAGARSTAGPWPVPGRAVVG